MAKQRNILTKEEIILENGTEFGKCFILETTAKLLYFNSILKGEVKKKGSFSKTLIEQKGLLGGLLCIGCIVPGVKEIASIMKGVVKIAEFLKNKWYIEKISNLDDLIREMLCNAKEFRETLARASIDIFQCYEMQFTHVTLNKNAIKAMHKLAEDAAERAIQHMVWNQNTSFNQSILSGKSKKDGNSIDFKFEPSLFNCSASDLYEKPGIVRHSKGQHQFWKRKDGNSEPSKYGYRLLSCEENCNTIKHQYKKDTDAKDHFARYEYLPNFENINESILKNVIEKVMEEGASAEERIKDTLQKTHKETTEFIQELEKSVKDLAECRDEDRELINEIKGIMSHLNIEECVTKIVESLLEGQKEIIETIEKSRQENASHHNEAKGDRQNIASAGEQSFQKIDDHLIDIKEKTSKIITKIEEQCCQKETAEEQSQKKWDFGLLNPVKTFTGRDVEMSKIQKEFETSNKGLDPPPIICISGLGGIGKTELARNYAYEHGKEFDDNVIWVNAENHTSLRESFLEFVRAKFPKEREKYEGMKETRTIVHEVYVKLKKRKCLIIFDNVESSSVFKELIPHLPKGQRTPCIIITSQSKEWKNVKFIELEGLTCEEAAGFIRNCLDLRESTHEEDIKLLADKLQCFPLALQQAVAYIKQKCDKKRKLSGSKFDIKNYLKKFDEQTKDLLTSKFLGDNRYTKTTFTTWTITMDKIKDDPDYGGRSEELLNMLSYFYPDNIHTDLFKGLGFPDDSLEEVVSLLERYSMIDVKGYCSFNIHRLVQRVVRINLVHEAKAEEVLYKTVELFYDQIQHEKENDINWDYERIMHVITSWEYGVEYEEIARKFSELPERVRNKLVRERKPSQAVEISEISIKAWKKHDIINKNTLDMMHWLTVYPDESIKTIKKIDDALEYHGEFLEKLTTKSKNDQIEIWSRVGNKEGYFKRTKDLLDKRKYCIGEIKNYDIELYNDLLNDCRAIKLYKDFLKDCRATLGDKHSQTLHAMFSIADLMKNAKMSEATTEYREVFNKSREILGYENWLTYNAMNNLAYIFKENGKIDDSIGIYQEFVNGCKENLGLDHELALTVKIKIADLLVRNKNIDAAITVYEELLNRRLKLDANGLTLKVLGTVAKLYFRQNYLDKAIEAYKDLLEEQRRNNQKPNLKTLDVIGRLHKQAGNMSEALPVYYEILELQNGMSGYGNKLMNTMKTIVSLLEESDKVQEAFEMYISLYRKETEMLGCKKVSFKYLAKIGDLSKKSKKIGSIDNAIKIYEKFLSECKKNLEPKDKKTWQAMEILANLLRDNGNIEEALGLYLEILSEKKGDALNDMGLNSALMTNLTALKQSNLNLVEVEKVYKNFHIDLKESLIKAG